MVVFVIQKAPKFARSPLLPSDALYHASLNDVTRLLSLVLSFVLNLHNNPTLGINKYGLL